MPRKMRLRLDALAVDSFEPGAAERPEGTVRGHEAISPAIPCVPQTAIQTCARKQTMYASCVALCECTDLYRACIL